MIEDYISKSVLIFTVIALVVLGTSAMADMGMGYGYGWRHGPAGHHHGYGSQGYGGFWGKLSEDEIKRFQDEREAFFEATKEIRQQLYQKRLELRSELAKKDPDPERAIGLQKEIAELWGQMGRKRLDHILKLKKINPDVGRGRMGFGMMGNPEYGGCPNAPYPGFGGSHGMGPGMMGSGYPMGPGMMRPGGPGSDYSRRYPGGQSSQTQ